VSSSVRVSSLNLINKASVFSSIILFNFFAKLFCAGPQTCSLNVLSASLATARFTPAGVPTLLIGTLWASNISSLFDSLYVLKDPS